MLTLPGTSRSSVPAPPGGQTGRQERLRVSRRVQPGGPHHHQWLASRLALNLLNTASPVGGSSNLKDALLGAALTAGGSSAGSVPIFQEPRRSGFEIQEAGEQLFPADGAQIFPSSYQETEGNTESAGQSQANMPTGSAGKVQFSQTPKRGQCGTCRPLRGLCCEATPTVSSGTPRDRN